MTFNKADFSILTALQSDADISMRALAEKLAMSASTLWRRINELEASGAIRGRVAVIDPIAVGVEVSAFVYVDMVNHEEEDRVAFESFVESTSEIQACFAVTGAHDYTLLVRTTSVSAFESLLMNRILAHKSVASATSQIALRELKFSTALPLGDA